MSIHKNNVASQTITSPQLFVQIIIKDLNITINTTKACIRNF